MTVSRHKFAAQVGGNSLNVISASVTVNEAWAPYGLATITVKYDSTLAASLDPRNIVTVTAQMSQEFGDSQPLSVLSTTFGGGKILNVTAAWATKFLYQVSAVYYVAFNTFGMRAATTKNINLLLRARNIDYAADTMTLELATLDSRLLDYALLSSTPYVSTTYSVRDIVSYVLSLIGESLEYGTVDGTIEPDAATWQPGVTAWDWLDPMLQTTGLRLQALTNGVIRLVSQDLTASGTTVLSYVDTITNLTDSITRDNDEWYDAVIVQYKWTDETGATQLRYDPSTRTPYSKVRKIEYDTPYPGSGAANNILNRALARGLTNTITAISDYTAVPRQAFTVTTPSSQQAGYISSITWSYPADTMTVSTRGVIEILPTAWVNQTVGKRWVDVPVGVKWNTYTV